MFNTSTVAMPVPPWLPPATIRWVGVLAAAGYSRLVGIGGRTSPHELPHKPSKVLVLEDLLLFLPPIVLRKLKKRLNAGNRRLNVGIMRIV